MSRQGKARPRTVENVKSFWNKEAKEWGDDPRVTIRDHYFRLLNINTISDIIKGQNKVLDIGCGTGFSTLFYSGVVHSIIGSDYSEIMIQKANKFLKDKKYFSKIIKKFTWEKKPKLKKNIIFTEGNIVNLTYDSAVFDCVISERVLVNLPTKEDQVKAIEEVSRVVKKKGIWIVGEASNEGHRIIDSLRRMFGLETIEKYWHNLYLNEFEFEKNAKRNKFVLKKKIKYETYQFLTKVVHPLVVDPAEPKFICGFNNAARIISQKFVDYRSVKKIGLKNFLLKQFRPVLKHYDKRLLPKYDSIVRNIVEKKPNFSGCSHHVLYIFVKS